ncbi:Prolyl endopeptidase [Moraxella catarrhalis]|nr:Prolyl endopeptidase [Moraxella catarrhalis]
MVLHPEKFRVAIPAAGVLDMLRYNDNFHTQYWAGEYGLPYDSVAQYKLLKSYSPYHNVKAGVCYPSTLVMTSKRDDRVTPSHSYKFVAALQDKQACANPTFLYAAEQFGHWANTYQEQKNDYSLFTSFALNEMNIKHVPDLTHRHDADFYKTDKWREEEAKEHAKQIKKLQQQIDKLNETKNK